MDFILNQINESFSLSPISPAPLSLSLFPLSDIIVVLVLLFSSMLGQFACSVSVKVIITVRSDASSVTACIQVYMTQVLALLF